MFIVMKMAWNWDDFDFTLGIRYYLLYNYWLLLGAEEN